jgi:hypothetical protein
MSADESNDPRHTELIAWLSDRGHSPEEVAKILAKVDEYDSDTVSGSIFDSIGRGDFDIAAIIDEALGQAD